jgi:hypothetical protein
MNGEGFAYFAWICYSRDCCGNRRNTHHAYCIGCAAEWRYLRNSRGVKS